MRGREISSKARNPAPHMFSRNGSFAFSAKEARWQLLFFWTHLVLLAVSPAATGSPPHSRSRSMSRWKYPENIVENIPRILSRISVFPSDLLGRGTDLLSGRRCARDYRGGLTWTAVRQVPLVEEPPRSRCLLLPAKRFCVTRHGKIFRIFTDIFWGIHTWACRKFSGGQNFLDEDERKCFRYSNWWGAKTQTKLAKRCQVDSIIEKLQHGPKKVLSGS